MRLHRQQRRCPTRYHHRKPPHLPSSRTLCYLIRSGNYVVESLSNARIPAWYLRMATTIPLVYPKGVPDLVATRVHHVLRPGNECQISLRPLHFVPLTPHPPDHSPLRPVGSRYPNVPKNIHFAESGDGLEFVRVYGRSGKPASIAGPAGEEAETETEVEPSAFPFAHSPGQYAPGRRS